MPEAARRSQRSRRRSSPPRSTSSRKSATRSRASRASRPAPAWASRRSTAGGRRRAPCCSTRSSRSARATTASSRLPDTGDLAADLKFVLRATVAELLNPATTSRCARSPPRSSTIPRCTPQWSERIDAPLTRSSEERLRSRAAAGRAPRRSRPRARHRSHLGPVLPPLAARQRTADAAGRTRSSTPPSADCARAVGSPDPEKEWIDGQARCRLRPAGGHLRVRSALRGDAPPARARGPRAAQLRGGQGARRRQTAARRRTTSSRSSRSTIRGALQEAMATPEGQAAAGDIPNFASGGATLMVVEA